MAQCKAYSFSINHSYHFIVNQYDTVNYKINWGNVSLHYRVEDLDRNAFAVLCTSHINSVCFQGWAPCLTSWHSSSWSTLPALNSWHLGIVRLSLSIGSSSSIHNYLNLYSWNIHTHKHTLATILLLSSECSTCTCITIILQRNLYTLPLPPSLLPYWNLEVLMVP